MAKEPTFDDACRVVAAVVLGLRPNAVGCRIQIDVPDGSGRLVSDSISVPLNAADEDDKEAQAIAALGKLKPGEYMSKRALAGELDLDPIGGHFGRLIKRLKGTDDEPGLVESHQTYGYRLKPKK